ncbi:MAG: DUF2461 domain-containing protein [Bacteroidetes bacterium]|nr:DUF2461 domain-containing protein [Bacteroidota bacterium]
MLQQSTLDFLKALKKHNDREWFDKNRTKYESAKADHAVFTEALIKELSKINPALGTLAVKDCVFRIYRDVRFSKNKAPYKTNFGCYFVEGGKKSEKAGFYIQLEPGNSFIAGGCWMPQAPLLKAIRQEIDYNLKDFEGILKEKKFKSLFGGLSDMKLKTTPKGYNAENPGIEHLRQTSFIVQTALADKDFTSKTIVKKSGEIYKAIYPFLKFLNTALS